MRLLLQKEVRTADFLSYNIWTQTALGWLSVYLFSDQSRWMCYFNSALNNSYTPGCESPALTRSCFHSRSFGSGSEPSSLHQHHYWKYCNLLMTTVSSQLIWHLALFLSQDSEPCTIFWKERALSTRRKSKFGSTHSSSDSLPSNWKWKIKFLWNTTSRIQENWTRGSCNIPGLIVFTLVDYFFYNMIAFS